MTMEILMDHPSRWQREWWGKKSCYRTRESNSTRVCDSILFTAIHIELAPYFPFLSWNGQNSIRLLQVAWTFKSILKSEILPAFAPYQIRPVWEKAYSIKVKMAINKIWYEHQRQRHHRRKTLYISTRWGKKNHRLSFVNSVSPVNHADSFAGEETQSFGMIFELWVVLCCMAPCILARVR